MVDDAAFTAATTSITPFGAMFDDSSPDSVNENDGGVVRMSANRNLYQTLRDASGAERGANVNSSNELTVTDASLITNTAGIGQTTDSAVTAGNGGSITGKLRTMSADLDAIKTAIQLLDNDPCTTGTKQFIPINISTATTTELTPSLAGASTHYYVCSINIGPAAGAQNFALVDDDSDGCGSVTSGLAGGTTAASGWNIGANGGLMLGGGGNAIARTNGTNRVICAVTSAAVQTSGVMVVVAAP